MLIHVVTMIRARTWTRRAAPFILAVLFVSQTRAQERIGYVESQSPVGVWQLVELKNWTSDGQMSQPYGENPSGMFVYTEQGHLSIQIMRTPAHPRLTQRPDAETLAGLARGYIAYYGTYEVDAENGMLLHKPVGSLNPNYIDTTRPRPYRITGDELTIDIVSEAGARFFRRLKRVESLDRETDNAH